jgi:hypothetical protein
MIRIADRWGEHKVRPYGGGHRSRRAGAAVHRRDDTVATMPAMPMAMATAMPLSALWGRSMRPNGCLARDRISGAYASNLLDEISS